jgi:hypothetical protein
MKHAVHCFTVTVILAATTKLAAGGEFPSAFLQGVGTNMQWSREITAPVVIETNTITARPVFDLSHVIIQPQVEIGRILVLYFGEGRLMGLEVNPRAKGVAREGQGSDEYSIPFCLVE